MGRGRHAGVWEIFQGSGSVGSSLWDRHVGYDPLHGPGPVGFPEKIHPTYHKKVDIVTEFGSNPPWMRQFERRVWRRWWRASGGDRVQ